MINKDTKFPNRKFPQKQNVYLFMKILFHPSFQIKSGKNSLSIKNQRETRSDKRSVSIATDPFAWKWLGIATTSVINTFRARQCISYLGWFIFAHSPGSIKTSRGYSIIPDPGCCAIQRARSNQLVYIFP